MSTMRDLHVEKVVVNIGVGEAGERLAKAEKVLEMVTKQKPVETLSKTVNRDLGIREGMPLGCKVTLRGDAAIDFVKQALSIREMRVPEYSFDQELHIGDRLVFGDMAIYSMVKNNTFNGMPLPDIGVLHENGEYQLVKRFGYGDFKERLS